MSGVAPTTEAGVSPRSRSTTSADVARLAAVSRSTVSQVLNGQSMRFSPETVERVRSAAAELGYVRSAAGRALVTGRSDFILLVAPHRPLTRLQDVVEVIAADIKELGFTVVAHFPPSMEEEELPSRLQHVVEALRPAGVIDFGGLSPADLRYLHAFGCPVFTQSTDDDLNPYIGWAQVEHLCSRGITQIAYAFLADGRGDPYGDARSMGVIQACAGLGLAPPTTVSVQLDATSPSEALRALTSGASPTTSPTASPTTTSPTTASSAATSLTVSAAGDRIGIACYNDEVALALVYAAERMGLAVPDQLAIIGVDRTSVGQVVAPRLTTVYADVPATLRNIRRAIVATYATGAVLDDPLAPRDIVSVLMGETT